MNTSPEQYISRLIDILQKKLNLLQDILVLTETQSSVINEDGIDSLNKLIDEKQQKIDDMIKLDEEFVVYFDRLKSTLRITNLAELDASGLAGSKQLKDITAETMNLIKKISAIEKQNNEKSKELLNQLGTEIKRINQGKKVNSAYKPINPNTSSYFIDKKK